MAIRPLASASIAAALVFAVGHCDHQLGGFGRQRPARRDPFARRPCASASGLPVSTTLVDDAERQRLLGREDLAGQRHAAHRLRAEAAHQALRAGPARHHADAGLGQAELDLRLGDADVGGGGELQPAAERMAVEHGDQRLPQPRQRGRRRGGRSAPSAPELERRSAPPQASMSPPAQKPLPSPVSSTTRTRPALGLDRSAAARAPASIGDIERVELLRPRAA